MARLTDNLDAIADRIRTVLSARDAAREAVLPLCRDSIRHCGNSIRAVHRQEFDRAESLLDSARQLVEQARARASEDNEIARAGYLRDAQKEFVEGSVVLALVTGKHPPEPEQLGVDVVPYLHGLADAVGELRRYLLDSTRKGDLSRGEEFLTAMDDIYNILVAIDFPDAVTGGLRRATDMVRGVLERTRSDLTLTIRQKELENRLDKFEREKEDK